MAARGARTAAHIGKACHRLPSRWRTGRKRVSPSGISEWTARRWLRGIAISRSNTVGRRVTTRDWPPWRQNSWAGPSVYWRRQPPPRHWPQSKNIPIVFTTGGDPVQLGLVTSLNRPGGNVTGAAILARVLVGKQLEILHELVPSAAVVGFLVNPKDANEQLVDAKQSAASLRQKLIIVKASTAEEIEAAFNTFVEQRVEALVVDGPPSSSAGVSVSCRWHSNIPCLRSMPFANTLPRVDW